MIEWYYRDTESRKIGPLSTDEFEERVMEGEIEARTRVWRSDLPEWTTYAALLAHEANCLTVAFGPATGIAPRSRSRSTFIALDASATHRPASRMHCASPGATAHPVANPDFELCAGCHEEMPADGFREIGARRICGHCCRHAQSKAERDRLRGTRGAEATLLGRYFVSLALVAGAFLAIRILLMGVSGRHPGTANARPSPGDFSPPAPPAVSPQRR